MKERVGLIMIIGLLISLWIVSRVYATHTDAFTFFIPYPADRLDDQFDAAQSDNFIDEDIVTTISISVLRDGSVIYYDHWEDGLESNIIAPIQSSTQVWGDGDPSNGSVTAGDVLSAGDIITLQNIVVLPRDSNALFFDGGDKITSVGGSIAATLAVWPNRLPSHPTLDGILFAGAWELYPTSRWGQTYIIPVGEDLSGLRGGFTTVGVNIQAVADGTSVQFDLDADGSPDPGSPVVLNEGQQFTQVSGVNVGAQVQASAPVQVHVFTGNPASTYEARAYTILPRNQWGDDYLAPRSSDGDYWLYNPDSTDLVVSAQTIVGTTAITIPANSTVRYPPPPAPLLSSTGMRFTSTDGRPFYGVAALDQDQNQDWGYALLPINNLASQALVGWAPGNNNSPPDGDQSQIYVTAVTTTTVFVDYDSNGTGDNSFLVPPLAEVPIADPDHDLTGARLYTTDGTPFIAVWGQDQGAPNALPSIDVGTNIVPLVAPSIQKTYSLVQGGYSCGTVTRGHTLRFQLWAYNDSANVIPSAVISDTLRAGLAYVPGSTTVGGSPIPDDSLGSTLFPLDEGGHNIGEIPGMGFVPVTYDAVIQTDGVYGNRVEFVSPATADPAEIEVSLPLRVAGYEVAKTLIDPSNGVVSPGQVITFGLTITNTGNVTITQLPLRDEFDGNYLTFRSASVPPDITAPSVITWTNLGTLPPTTVINLSVSFAVSDTLPAETITTTNLALSEGVQDSNGRTQAILCGQTSVNMVGPTSTPTPTPTFTPTPTPTLPPSTSTPTPTPTSSPPAAPPPAETPAAPTPTSPPPSPPPPPPSGPTPTPAVSFLPETGVAPSSEVSLWPLAALSILGLLALWTARRRRE